LILFKWHVGKEPKRTLLSKTKEPFEDFIQMAFATRNTTICHEKLDPLQVNRFKDIILLIVQYKYLKSFPGDFIVWI